MNVFESFSQMFQHAQEHHPTRFSPFDVVSDIDRIGHLFNCSVQISFQVPAEQHADDNGTMNAWKAVVQEPNLEDHVPVSMIKLDTLELSCFMNVDKSVLQNNGSVDRQVPGPINDRIAIAAKEPFSHANNLAADFLFSENNFFIICSFHARIPRKNEGERIDFNLETPLRNPDSWNSSVESSFFLFWLKIVS